MSVERWRSVLGMLPNLSQHTLSLSWFLVMSVPFIRRFLQASEKKVRDVSEGLALMRLLKGHLHSVDAIHVCIYSIGKDFYPKKSAQPIRAADSDRNVAEIIIHQLTGSKRQHVNTWLVGD